MDPPIKNYLVTGPPGCGKTTLLLELKNEFESHGFKAGGFLTTEIRDRRRRVGFAICDLASGQEGILAHIESPSKKRVGRYGVNIEILETVGVGALKKSMSPEVDFVVIDELGPMELFSFPFQNSVRQLLMSQKVVLGSIHYRSQHKFLLDVRARKDTEIIILSRENREQMHPTLVTKIMSSLAP